MYLDPEGVRPGRQAVHPLPFSWALGICCVPERLTQDACRVPTVPQSTDKKIHKTDRGAEHLRFTKAADPAGHMMLLVLRAGERMDSHADPFAAAEPVDARRGIAKIRIRTGEACCLVMPPQLGAVAGRVELVRLHRFVKRAYLLCGGAARQSEQRSSERYGNKNG
jgi:hypothetical protein